MEDISGGHFQVAQEVRILISRLFHMQSRRWGYLWTTDDQTGLSKSSATNLICASCNFRSNTVDDPTAKHSDQATGVGSTASTVSQARLASVVSDLSACT